MRRVIELGAVLLRGVVLPVEAIGEGLGHPFGINKPGAHGWKWIGI